MQLICTQSNQVFCCWGSQGLEVRYTIIFFITYFHLVLHRATSSHLKSTTFVTICVVHRARNMLLRISMEECKTTIQQHNLSKNRWSFIINLSQHDFEPTILTTTGSGTEAVADKNHLRLPEITMCIFQEKYKEAIECYNEKMTEYGAVEEKVYHENLCVANLLLWVRERNEIRRSLVDWNRNDDRGE